MARKRIASEPVANTAPRSLELVQSSSPAAVLAFLKQSALETAWSTRYLGKTLGVPAGAARGVTAELAAAGYIEPVGDQGEQWRNTRAGNQVAGVKAPRLTRATAEKAVGEFLGRVQEVNADHRFPLRVTRAIAAGGYLTDRDRIQDVDISVALENKTGARGTPEQAASVLKFLRGKGRALRIAPLRDGMLSMPGRVLFSSQ